MSDDLIRRSDAIKALEREKSDWNCDYNVPIDNCIKRLNKVKSAPSIDICFCRECKHYNGKYCFNGNATAPKAPNANDFCSWGERRADDE